MNLGRNRWILGFLFFGLLLGGFSSGLQAQEEDVYVLASQIIDQDVYDEKNKLIGEVDDIIIRRSGRAKLLTVEFGGFLDIGDKLVALPFKRFSMKNGNVALEVTEQQLEKKPEFDYYPQKLRPDYYYRGRPYAGRYRYSPHGYYYGPYGPNRPNAPMEPYEWTFSPSRFLASTVMNRRLINEEGKDIGRVKDLMINRENNTVEKIIISSMDIPGEDVHVALPYQPLGFGAYGLVYDIMPRKLKDHIFPYKK